jgi:hypothetical protein
MFAQMKSRSRGSVDDPSVKEDWRVWLIALSSIFIVFGGLLVYIWKTSGPGIIMVHGERCEMHFVQTGATSWGSPLGYTEAICPSDKK